MFLKLRIITIARVPKSERLVLLSIVPFIDVKTGINNATFLRQGRSDKFSYVK